MMKDTLVFHKAVKSFLLVMIITLVPVGSADNTPNEPFKRKSCIELLSSLIKFPKLKRTGSKKLVFKMINKPQTIETNLTDDLFEFAKKINHPSQLKKRLEDLQRLAEEVLNVPLSPNFGILKSDLIFLEHLKRAKLKNSNNRIKILQAVNNKISDLGEGEFITEDFIKFLRDIDDKIEQSRHKIEILKNSHIVRKNGSGDLVVFNPNGHEAEVVWKKANAVISKYPPLHEEIIPSISEVHTLKSYLESFSLNENPFYSDLSDSLRLLLRFDKKYNTDHYTEVSFDIFKKSNDLIKKYGKKNEGNYGLLEYDNFKSLRSVSSDILLNSLTYGSSINEILDYFFNLNLNNKFFLMEDLYGLISENLDWSSLFTTHIRSIKKHAQISNKIEFAENFFLEYLLFSIKMAKKYDHLLGQGAGFHNAERVNNLMKGAAKAVESFKESYHIKNTNSLRLDSLTNFFKGMQYNSLGERLVGDNISLLEAFNIKNKTRTNESNPYQAIEYFLNETNARGKLKIFEY